MFTVENLAVRLGDKNILQNVHFTIDTPGQLVGILGANGSGKTPLLRAVAGLLPHTGGCLMDGVPLESLSTRCLAQTVSYIPQQSGISVSMSAREVVLMGCNPRLGVLQSPTAAMCAAAEEALRTAGLADKAEQDYLALSGGERQLCILARTFVEDAPLLLLDEPDSALDLANRSHMAALLAEFVHASGKKEELQVANYLKEQCETLGVPAELESFRVAMGEIEEAHLYADGMGIPCKALTCCGSGSVEGELYYMPGTDPVSVAGAKDKIVLMDTQGIGFFAYQDLMKAGAKAILFQYGNSYYPHTDIDQRDLREAVVGEEKKVLCAMIHSAQAVELVKNKVKQIRLEIRQKEYDGESHNVIAELPGKREEWIVLSAHYDTTSLSHGAYDNMSGCAGLLGIMEQMKGKELNYGLRFVFCGSEERGLLGSKAYVRDHEKELRQTVLNINLDMIGTYMGKFIACVSAEEKLTHYISYMAAEVGFPIAAENGVYSSDSTPFADHGVPAVSFARIANGNVAPIHCRYDVKDVMSMEQLQKDIDFLTVFTGRFANAAVCPVAREIPETIRITQDAVPTS